MARIPHRKRDSIGRQTPIVEWAVKNGLSDGTNPSDSITREQIAVMLWRYAGSPVSEGDLGGFTDGDEAGSWAAEALKWAVENGVMNGVGNQKLDPKGYADRAQVAQFLKNFIENVM